MNQNSLLCKFIAEHPADWEERLTRDYSIKIKREGDLAILNYGYICNYADPIVQEARGIILDIARLEVVCWPFRKFGNHHESYADPIDWESARVLEKVDGSIVKLWYDVTREKWQSSTNATIRAEAAPIERSFGLYFGDVIKKADNYGNIPFEALDRSLTYIFELVSPETQVVIRYETPSLYHLGTRSNETGEEFDLDIGIKKPRAFPLASLSDCIKAALALNQDKNGEIADEGFVVVDRNWHRVKVKSPDYIMMNRLTQISELSKKEALNILLHEPQNVEIISAATPALCPVLKYYDFRLSELKYQADRLAELARRLYNEYSGDRAAVAKVIAAHKLSSVGFLALESDKSGHELLLEQRPERYAKLIPDYEPNDDLRTLFSEVL